MNVVGAGRRGESSIDEHLGHESLIPGLSVNMWMLKFGLNAPTGGPRLVLREENC